MLNKLINKIKNTSFRHTSVFLSLNKILNWINKKPKEISSWDSHRSLPLSSWHAFMKYYSISENCLMKYRCSNLCLSYNTFHFFDKEDNKWWAKETDSNVHHMLENKMFRNHSWRLNLTFYDGGPEKALSCSTCTLRVSLILQWTWIWWTESVCSGAFTLLSCSHH